jgi:hypothetical protein
MWAETGSFFRKMEVLATDNDTEMAFPFIPRM